LKFTKKQRRVSDLNTNAYMVLPLINLVLLLLGLLESMLAGRFVDIARVVKQAMELFLDYEVAFACV
jgi:hypothetical protein